MILMCSPVSDCVEKCLVCDIDVNICEKGKCDLEFGFNTTTSECNRKPILSIVPSHLEFISH